MTDDTGLVNVVEKIPYDVNGESSKIGQFSSDLQAIYYLKCRHSILGFIYEKEKNQTSIQCLDLNQKGNNGMGNSPKELTKIVGSIEANGVGKITFHQGKLHVLAKFKENRHSLYKIDVDAVRVNEMKGVIKLILGVNRLHD